MTFSTKVQKLYKVVAFDLPIDDDRPEFKPLPKALNDALDKWYDEFELQSMDCPTTKNEWNQWLDGIDPKRITGIPEYVLELYWKGAKPGAFEALQALAKQFGLVAETVKTLGDTQYKTTIVMLFTGRK